MNKIGLGRGLDILLSPDHAPAEDGGTASQILMVPTDALMPNAAQPRKTMREEGLEELAKSIRNQGVVQPLLVRETKLPGRYQIVAGERRWRAATMAGVSEVPVYVRELSDEDVMLVALVENVQREDLNPAEEAQALQELKTRLDLSQEELASRLGKSRSQIANSLRLLQLSKGALEALKNGEISAGHARCLLPMGEDKKTMKAFLAWMKEKAPSVRECEEVVESWKADRPLPWQRKSKGGDAAPDSVSHVQPPRRLPRSEVFKQLEKELADRLNCRARISGNETKGKVSFLYKSPDELKAILASLGLGGKNG